MPALTPTMEEKMEKAAFTPGPWRLACYGSASDPRVRSWGVKYGRAGNTLAMIDGTGNAALRNDANAALIAAAPEMYEALKDAANSAGFQYMLGELRDRIDAALARAEGRS